MKSNNNVSVFGGGSWGTSLANLIAHNSKKVNIWAKESSVCDSINKIQENKLFLPGHKLSKNLNATNDIKNKDLINSDIYIFAIPTQYLRPILIKLKKYLNKKSLIVNASKGIEIKSLKFINEVFNETLNVSPRKYITLSGPSFAKDVIAELPTAVTLASKSGLSLEMVSSIFDNTNLKVYRSNDIQGVEIAGALKNVIAIGAGIIDGVGNSESTKAAFITRSLFEIRQFSKILGAKEKTFLGLSGVGDLMLTCYGIQSRNRNLGFMIGKGMNIKSVLRSSNSIAEGYYTSKAFIKLAKKYKFKAPILESIYAVLYKNYSPENLVSNIIKKGIISDI
jgi:glycerol-3-phosphate dehydrogenase (NAD(P)+)|tara:strand:- start:5971 stop:6981 length:1011 start_codon:yes stop_codon:yes gene_type:complete